MPALTKGVRSPATTAALRPAAHTSQSRIIFSSVSSGAFVGGLVGLGVGALVGSWVDVPAGLAGGGLATGFGTAFGLAEEVIATWTAS